MENGFQHHPLAETVNSSAIKDTIRITAMF